jgi:hypothetical protein
MAGGVKVKIALTGPLFDGQAGAAAKDFTDSLAGEVAEIGRDWIRVEAMGMDKSGRGGTGAAAEGVELAGGNGTWTIIGGIREGRYAWSWLEGTSRRNQSTGFGGYHTFRRTALRMRKQVTPFAQQRLEEYLARMGGGQV